MNVKRLQVAAFLVSGLFIPLYTVGKEWLTRSKFSVTAFLATVYVAVVVGVVSTVVHYKREQANSLPNWRRIPYASALVILLALCLVPLATWPIAVSGTALPAARVVILGLFFVNVAAAAMVCFGRGWSRVGLLVVSYWIFFLWMFPLALRE